MKTITTAILLLSCLAAVTWWTYRLNGSPKVGIDDANIFFSYAHNVASGNGITYAHNSDRVEGITSLLWMLICAFIFFLGLNESAVLGVSVLILFLTQWILFRAIHLRALDSRQPTWPYHSVYLVLLLSSPAYITWMTITLMDTCLWGLIIAAMTYVVLSPPLSPRGQIVAAIPFVLAPMSRPEGMLVAPVLVGLLWLRSQSPGLPSQTNFCIGLGSAMFLFLAALTAFRLTYFGYPFPNTYYAKVSPSLTYNLREGAAYLYSFTLSGAVAGGLVAIVLVAGASWVGRSVSSIHSSTSLRSLSMAHTTASDVCALVALGLLIVPVLTGGDHFKMFRFYQPVYPILCLTVVFLVADTCTYRRRDLYKGLTSKSRHGTQLVAVGMVLGCWLLAYSFDNPWSKMRSTPPIAHEFRIAADGIARGATLKTIFANSGRFPAIGVITAGGIARTYPGPIVDLMGLSNRFIGHFRGDRRGVKNHAAFEKDGFFQVEPELLLVSPPVPPETLNVYSAYLKGLLEDPRFTSHWRYGILRATDEPGCVQDAFCSKAFLDNMPSKGGVEFRETMIWANKWVEAAALSGRQN